jgi:hypothetical protein
MLERLTLILLLLTHLVAPAIQADRGPAQAAAVGGCCATVGPETPCGDASVANGCGCSADSIPTDHAPDRPLLPSRPSEILASCDRSTPTPRLPMPATETSTAAAPERGLPVLLMLALLCVWRT